MASTYTNQFTCTGVNPMFPFEAKEISVALAPSLTLAAGTVLGEIQLSDTYTISTGSQASGTFTLTFGGQTTATIARNAAAATVQTALLALSTVGAGNATVVLTSGTPGTDAVYTVTFAGALAYTTNGALTANFASLATPGNASLAHTVTGQSLGTFKAYNDSNTDGSQVARAILRYACATDSSGNITFGTASGGGVYGQTYKSAPAFVAGAFQTSDLTGLDAAAVTDLGRIIEGVLASGILRLP